VLDQLHVELKVNLVHISVPHSNSLSTHLQAHGEATLRHAAHEAWCGYVL